MATRARSAAATASFPRSFEAARPQIVRFLTYDQIRDQLEKLRARSKIVRLVKADGASPPVPPADAPKTPPAPPTPKAQPEGKK